MLLFSWNVASWGTTLKNIRNGLGMTAEQFFLKHQADIVCLQEVKVNTQKLETHPRNYAATMDAYDSFWAIST